MPSSVWQLVREQGSVTAFDDRMTRRGALATAAALCAVGSARAAVAPAASAPWTRATYEQVMHASGLPVSLTDAQFDAIQRRKPVAMKLIETYLKQQLHSAAPW